MDLPRCLSLDLNAGSGGSEDGGQLLHVAGEQGRVGVGLASDIIALFVIITLFKQENSFF